jgi:hypothetical protein
MQEIRHKDKVVAMIHRSGDWKEGLDFMTPNSTFIQAGTWWYPKDKILKSHRHVINERKVDRTQEVVVVMSGKLRIDLYDDSNAVFHHEILSAGDMGVIFEGGHGYEILEDNTLVIEIKNGPFISVEKDKELIY